MNARYGIWRLLCKCIHRMWKKKFFFLTLFFEYFVMLKLTAMLNVLEIETMRSNTFLFSSWKKKNIFIQEKRNFLWNIFKEVLVIICKGRLKIFTKGCKNQYLFVKNKICLSFYGRRQLVPTFSSEGIHAVAVTFEAA